MIEIQGKYAGAVVYAEDFEEAARRFLERVCIHPAMEVVRIAQMRAIHIPTRMAVRSSDERSQAQNKSRARERLILKLSQQNTAAEADATRRRWVNHTTLRRGNPVKTLRGPL